MACIWSKLGYGLQTAWLSKLQRRKLDGFQNRCLRRIIGILPSFYSRISNAEVLRRCRTVKFSHLLLEQQLLLLGKIARLPNDSIIRSCVFQPDSLELRELNSRRRRGRPRANWMKEMMIRAVQISGSRENLPDLIGNKQQWKQKIRVFCRDSELVIS